jgi:hypothetical protein
MRIEWKRPRSGIRALLLPAGFPDSGSVFGDVPGSFGNHSGDPGYPGAAKTPLASGCPTIYRATQPGLKFLHADPPKRAENTEKAVFSLLSIRAYEDMKFR